MGSAPMDARLSMSQPLRQALWGLKEKLVPIIPTGALYMHLQGALVGRIAPNPPDSCPGGALRATRPTSAAGRAALIKRPLHPYSRISGSAHRPQRTARPPWHISHAL